MDIFLPIAGVHADMFVLMAVAAVVGVCMGLFGVGGGFMMTPMLIFLGLPPAIVVGSGAAQIGAAAASGSVAHARAGNVDFKMGALMVFGGIAGGKVGVTLFKALKATGNVESTVRIAYVVLLALVGIFMMIEGVRTIMKGHNDCPKRIVLGSHLPFQTHFVCSGIRTSMLLPVALGVIVGILTAILGVGGGFIAMPAMVYVLGMPTIIAIGTSLFQIVFTTAIVAIQQAGINHSLDIVLVLVLLATSAVGAHVGAMLARLLKGAYLRIIFAAIVLAVMVRMAWALVATPASLVSIGAGGG